MTLDVEDVLRRESEPRRAGPAGAPGRATWVSRQNASARVVRQVAPRRRPGSCAGRAEWTGPAPGLFSGAIRYSRPPSTLVDPIHRHRPEARLDDGDPVGGETDVRRVAVFAAGYPRICEGKVHGTSRCAGRRPARLVNGSGNPTEKGRLKIFHQGFGIQFQPSTSTLNLLATAAMPTASNLWFDERRFIGHRDVDDIGISWVYHLLVGRAWRADHTLHTVRPASPEVKPGGRGESRRRCREEARHYGFGFGLGRFYS